MTKKKKAADGFLVLSSLGRCLTEASVVRVAKEREKHVRHKTINVLGEVVEKVFVPVSFFGGQQFADIKTGTLFDAESGECLSSSHLRIFRQASRQKRRASC